MARVTPAAHVDRHQRWMSPGSRFMDTLVWLAVGLVVLMAGATAAVVILAARAGLEAHRETIEVLRSEERRVGKECVSTCRSWWSTCHQKKNSKIYLYKRLTRISP